MNADAEISWMHFIQLTVSDDTGAFQDNGISALHRGGL